MPRLELTLIALAVAMDAFSLSVGVGMHSLTFLKQGCFSLLVGFFHVLMTYLGLVFGRFVGGFVGSSAIYIGGGILLVLGIRMIREETRKKENGSFTQLQGYSLILLPLTVSIDALTVGFGLGAVGMTPFLVALFFGLTAFVLTIGGLFLGDLVGKYLERSGLLGGIILLLLGLKMVLGF